MPFSTKWERHGVTWTFWGVVTGEELLQSNEQIYGDGRFDQMKYQIVDLTGVDRFDVSPEDMFVIASTDKAAARSNPFVRVAVIARDESIRRLSAAYDAMTHDSPWTQRLFETEAEAREWAEGGRL